MRINRLKLVNYRNHKYKEVEFGKDTTLIIGPNGSGKTNILEAVYLLSTAKSIRAVYERDLIFIGEPFARLELDLLTISETSNSTEHEKVELVLQRKENNRITKLFKINGVTKSIGQATFYFDTVMFAPEDIRIVAGSPSRRRDYLNKILSSVDKNYRTNLSVYEKVLRQRNSILEDLGLKDLYLRESEIKHDLEYWDKRLIEAADYVGQKRLEFFEFARSNLPKISNDLFANGILQLNYHQNTITHDKLANNLKMDFMRKTTSVGPHRDDYDFVLLITHKSDAKKSAVDEFLGLMQELDAKEFSLDLKSFGSRGQQRTAVLALKVLEMMYVKEIKKTDPVLLLDDIFSELDEDYRKLVLNITKGKQTIISSAVEVDGYSEGLRSENESIKVIRL